jgi:hypothetical protein
LYAGISDDCISISGRIAAGSAERNSLANRALKNFSTGPKIYRAIDELQADLDSWIAGYNERRPHQGRWCFGKTLCRPFLTYFLWRGRNL